MAKVGQDSWWLVEGKVEGRKPIHRGKFDFFEVGLEGLNSGGLDCRPSKKYLCLTNLRFQSGQ